MLAGLLALTALMSGGCASVPGKKQASREELIATLRSLEPLQSKGRIPRAKVVAAFDLGGMPHRRGGSRSRSGRSLLWEEWRLGSGMRVRGGEHRPLAVLSRETIDALIAKGPIGAVLERPSEPADPKTPEFYDTIRLFDRGGCEIAGLQLDYWRRHPADR